MFEAYPSLNQLNYSEEGHRSLEDAELTLSKEPIRNRLKAREKGGIKTKKMVKLIAKVKLLDTHLLKIA